MLQIFTQVMRTLLKNERELPNHSEKLYDSCKNMRAAYYRRGRQYTHCPFGKSITISVAVASFSEVNTEAVRSPGKTG